MTSLLVAVLTAGGLLAPGAAGAADSPTVRLSVVTRSDVASATQSALFRLKAGGIEAPRLAGPAHPSGSSFQLEVPESGLAASLRLLRADPSIVAVDRVQQLSLLDAPSDPYYKGQRQSYLDEMDLSGAWTITHGDPSIRIAIIDTGATTSHPDLAGKVVGRYNAVSGSSTITDTDGHGTQVASIAAANTDNAEGIAGAGWNSDLLIVRVSDSQDRIYDADVAEGVNWAVSHGAQVINLSLGGPAVGTALKAAIAHAVSSNVVVVAAAGDTASNAKVYPAALPGVLAVGAAYSGDDRADFSTYGSWVDVAAPGTGIWGASNTGTGYVKGDGTSFAAPLVAGVAALVRASRPTLSAARVVTAIERTAGNKPSGFAHGLVDAYQALGYQLTLPGPGVTSPAPNDTVGADISVEVNVPVSVQADSVRVQLVGRGAVISAPLTGGTATVDVPAWGSAGARTLRVVACRRTFCSPTGTDVPITVDYPAPVMSPDLDGSSFTTPYWTAEATSDAPVVRFLGDGAVDLGTVSGAELAVAVPISALANGSHQVTAVACSANGKLCDTVLMSSPVTVSVEHLVPRITSLSRSVISPNGDKVADNTTVHFRVDVASDVHIDITNATGYRTVHLGQRSPGAYTYVWNGKMTSFSEAVPGTYHVQVREVGTTLTGTSTRSVRVDLTGPRVTSARSSYPMVFPHRDGYRDTVTFSAHLPERSTTAKVVVRKRFGAVVWTGRAMRTGDNVHVVWPGTTTSGKALPKGVYTWEIDAFDAVGNEGAGGGIIQLSTRRAVNKTFTKSVTALDAAADGYQFYGKGGLVEVYRSFGPEALRYEAKSDGAVRTIDFGPLLPHATEYKSFRVSLYGRGVHGGRAYLAFLNSSDAEIGGVRLTSSRGTHTGQLVAESALKQGTDRGLRWEIVVSDGDVYDVRSFTVTVHYFALVA